MTAVEALQAAVNLLRQARNASDSGQPDMAQQLVAEATAWAMLAIALEAGVPAPGPSPQPGMDPLPGL